MYSNYNNNSPEVKGVSQLIQFLTEMFFIYLPSETASKNSVYLAAKNLGMARNPAQYANF